MFWRALFICASLILNICVLPGSLFMGGMATDAPGSGLTEFFIGFFLIQGIPLIILIISVVCMVRYERNNQKAN